MTPTGTLERTPPSVGARNALPVSLVARFAASFAAVAADWPDQPASGDGQRTSVRVAVTPTHDVWLIRWPEGTRVRPHDHGGSVGAFAVVRGGLVEYRWDSEGKVATRHLGAGETAGIDHGIVHDVVGAPGGALSLHVYSPPLSTMAIYDDDVREVVDVETVGADELTACDPAAWAALAGAADEV